MGKIANLRNPNAQPKGRQPVVCHVRMQSCTPYVDPVEERNKRLDRELDSLWREFWRKNQRAYHDGRIVDDDALVRTLALHRSILRG